MKKLIGIGLICCLLGAAAAVAALAMSGWKWEILSNTEPYEKKEQVFDLGGAAQIEIEDETTVRIGVSPDQRAHMTVYENEYCHYETEIGSVVSIQSVRTNKWYQNNVNFRPQQPRELTLLLPADYHGAIWVQTDAGRIELSGLQLSEAALRSDAGALTVTDAEILGDMNLRTDVGAITVTGAEIQGDCVLTTDTGSVTLKQVRVSKTCQAATDVGAMSVSDVQGNEIALKTDVGSIELTGVEAQRLTAETELGGIRVKGVDAQDVAFTSDTGNISGVLEGAMADYAIEAVGDHHPTLPEKSTGNGRTLRVESDTGEVNLKFSK